MRQTVLFAALLLLPAIALAGDLGGESSYWYDASRVYDPPQQPSQWDRNNPLIEQHAIDEMVRENRQLHAVEMPKARELYDPRFDVRNEPVFRADDRP